MSVVHGSTDQVVLVPGAFTSDGVIDRSGCRQWRHEGEQASAYLVRIISSV
jgi:hypothetical protein